ncbi:hypothetical protein AB1Y20_016514 [Prymnesium parvum]|uniref:F5/8 type C domain-containing protein n=1 Tax=Prymnesium parvum TaxID=97485 RepID=A0AB34IE01_PRYPA
MLSLLTCAVPAKAPANGILFVSLDSGGPRILSKTEPFKLKELLISLTLHDSGQSSGAFPLKSREHEQADALRLSFSARDHRLAVVLGAAVSATDLGAGKPVAYANYALHNLTAVAFHRDQAAAMSVLLTPSTADWTAQSLAGEPLESLPLSPIQRCVAMKGQEFASPFETLSLPRLDLRYILIYILSHQSSTPGLAAELASESDEDLLRRIGCPSSSLPSSAMAPRLKGDTLIDFTVTMKLLLCPEGCLSSDRTTCTCPVIRVGDEDSDGVAVAAAVRAPSSGGVGCSMRALPAVRRHGLASSQVQMAWRSPLTAQRFRLLTGKAPAFWAEAWHFFADAACAEPLFPDSARDSGHEGCCSTGCIKGVEVGACCCERMHRSTPCAAGECWVEVDFGATVEVACMRYLMSGGEADGAVRLEVWRDERGWAEPPGAVQADDAIPSSLPVPTKPLGTHRPTPPPRPLPAASHTGRSGLGEVKALLRTLPAVRRHGLASSQVQMAWRSPLTAQRFRLLTGKAPAFWAEAWHFFADAACAEPLFPDSARDSGHEGCCSTGCIKGVEVGACCCERMHRSTPCAAGECWVEVDFGATVEVACMRYLMSGGEADGAVRLEVWRDERGWAEPEDRIMNICRLPLGVLSRH